LTHDHSIGGKYLTHCRGELWLRAPQNDVAVRQLTVTRSQSCHEFHLFENP
jgi:hypothetical protein